MRDEEEVGPCLGNGFYPISIFLFCCVSLMVTASPSPQHREYCDGREANRHPATTGGQGLLLPSGGGDQIRSHRAWMSDWRYCCWSLFFLLFLQHCTWGLLSSFSGPLLAWGSRPSVRCTRSQEPGALPFRMLPLYSGLTPGPAFASELCKGEIPCSALLFSATASGLFAML